MVASPTLYSAASSAIVARQQLVEGFVTGIAAWSTADRLESHPGEGRHVFVDNYCRSKPLDRILGARA